MPDHDCNFISVCCNASPEGELCDMLTGRCTACHEGTGFACEEYEDCPNNTDTRMSLGG
jgi:hypothetical protein